MYLFNASSLPVLAALISSVKASGGFLLKNAATKKLFFRVYTSEDKKSFTDYRIDAEDIQIIIDDDKLLIE